MNEMWRATEKMKAAAAQACEATAAASGGGVLNVAMRIDRNGRAGNVCIEKDSSHDEKLRACVIGAVTKFTFPKPVRGTFVNYGTDVTVSPRGSAQRGLCAE